jgi:hypothetical protein
MPQIFIRTADITVTLNFPPEVANAENQMARSFGSSILQGLLIQQ